MCLRLYLESKPLSVGWRREVRRSLSKMMEVWFPQQIILKIYRAFSLWDYAIAMIGPLQYERASNKNVKGLALSQISAETVFCCVLSFGSQHELHVVLQGSAEGKDRKRLGFGQRDVLKQDRTTSVKLGKQELRTCNKGFLQLRIADASAEVQKGRRFLLLLFTPCLGLSKINKYQKICLLRNFGTWIILSTSLNCSRDSHFLLARIPVLANWIWSFPGRGSFSLCSSPWLYGIVQIPLGVTSNISAHLSFSSW